MVYCGVDGGGTKTKLVIQDKKGNRFEAIGGPSSIDTVSQEETIHVIQQLLETIYQEQPSLDAIDSLFVGLGGVASEKDKISLSEQLSLLTQIKPGAFIQVENDIMNAYYASCEGRENITLIIGTGSVGFGMDEEGRTHRTSGIHFLEGDFGSGYDLGRRAIEMMTKSFDRRIEPSLLTTHLLNIHQLNRIDEVIAFLRDKKLDRTYVASFAKDVIIYAKENDPYAIQILKDAAKEIALCVIGVDKNIQLQNREIGIVGTLGAQTPYFEMIQEEILSYDSRFHIHTTILDPVVGALYKAMQNRSV